MKTKIITISVFFALAIFLTNPAGIAKAEVTNVQTLFCVNGCPVPKQTSTVPVVISIIRASPDPTDADRVDFLVTFSELVKGVDKGDFAPVVQGIEYALVADVFGYGSTYIVSVYTGYGDGTLSLDLVDYDLISNATGNKLGGVGLHNGDFTGGESYTIVRSGR